MWGDNVGVLPLSPHGDNIRYSPIIDPGGIRRRRGDGDIRGVFFAGTEVGGMTGRRMPGKGKQPRDTHRTLHVLAPEGKVGKYIGGTGTTT